MTEKSPDPMLLVGIFPGMLIGSLAEAFNEIAKELRTYAGSDFDERLDMLEAKAIRSVENAPLDGIPEADQLLLIEQTRSSIVAIFKGIRKGG